MTALPESAIISTVHCMASLCAFPHQDKELKGFMIRYHAAPFDKTPSKRIIHIPQTFYLTFVRKRNGKLKLTDREKDYPNNKTWKYWNRFQVSHSAPSQ